MRLRTVYNQHKTDTGRWSSGIDKSDADKAKGVKKQQLQNVPKKLRDIFEAEPGWMFVGADWAAIQFALIMRRAEKVVQSGYHWDLMERQQRGELDPHRFLAAGYVGEENVTDEIRQLMKGYTYGRSFFGKPKTLGIEQGHNLAVSTGICDAHDRTYRLLEWQRAEVERAAQRRYVEAADGWRRWFWDMPTRGPDGWLVKPKPQEVLACAIQGDEGALFRWVAGNMVLELGPDGEIVDEVRMLTATYDSIALECREESAPKWREWLVAQMQAKCPFLDDLGFRVESKIRRNWKEIS